MTASTAPGVLAEDKKLSWDDTIRTHLPNFNPVEDPVIGEEETLIDAGMHQIFRLLARPDL